MKRIFSLLLSLILLLSLFPAEAFAEKGTEATENPGTDNSFADNSALNATIETGSCGTGVTYALDSSGNLIITPEGSGNHIITANPWSPDKVQKIIVKNGITEIGDGVFMTCKYAEYALLPDSLTKIGSSSFAYCFALKSITIPDSVKSIGNNAFYRCSTLKAINIPSLITSIENETFCGCTSITSVTIPVSIKSIGERAFVGCPIETATYSGTSAQWAKITIASGNSALTNVVSFLKYTVKYNGNGGSGAPSAQTKTDGVNLTLSSTKPTRTGYDF